jgi:hypothetical protein
MAELERQCFNMVGNMVEPMRLPICYHCGAAKSDLTIITLFDKGIGISYPSVCNNCLDKYFRLNVAGMWVSKDE